MHVRKQKKTAVVLMSNSDTIGVDKLTYRQVSCLYTDSGRLLRISQWCRVMSPRQADCNVGKSDGDVAIIRDNTL